MQYRSRVFAFHFSKPKEEQVEEEEENKKEKEEEKKGVTVDQARMARATRGTNGERNDAERHLYWDLLICSQPRH